MTNITAPVPKSQSTTLTAPPPRRAAAKASPAAATPTSTQSTGTRSPTSAHEDPSSSNDHWPSPSRAPPVTRSGREVTERTLSHRRGILRPPAVEAPAAQKSARAMLLRHFRTTSDSARLTHSPTEQRRGAAVSPAAPPAPRRPAARARPRAPRRTRRLPRAACPRRAAWRRGRCRRRRAGRRAPRSPAGRRRRS